MIKTCGRILTYGRLKKVIPKAGRRMVTAPLLNAFLPVPAENQIVRIRSKKEWILLEEKGILGVQVRFNISDRKKLGINNKVRKLSLEYKNVVQNLKNVFHDYISNGFNTPIGPPYFSSVKGVRQVFTGYYNGLKLTVPISREEFGKTFSGQGGTNAT